MKQDEINQRFQVPLNKQKKFEEAGLFEDTKTCDGCCEYEEKDIEKLSTILSLDKVGMLPKVIQHYLYLKQQGDTTKEERKQMLRTQRDIVLNDLHEKQKCLDCLDYLIYELD